MHQQQHLLPTRLPPAFHRDSGAALVIQGLLAGLAGVATQLSVSISATRTSG
jgi:hypothetical protein